MFDINLFDMEINENRNDRILRGCEKGNKGKEWKMKEI